MRFLLVQATEATPSGMPLKSGHSSATLRSCELHVASVLPSSALYSSKPFLDTR
jgi:hypothetical protein